MQNFAKGVVAGFAGTVVLSIIMVMKSMMGIMPQLDVTAMLNQMVGSVSGAWVAHFVIGSVVWGGLFALINTRLPGSTHWFKGMVLGLVAWLVMMVTIMPMAGQGLFGMNIGIMAPVMTAILHVIFGATMGATYGALIMPSDARLSDA